MVRRRDGRGARTEEIIGNYGFEISMDVGSAYALMCLLRDCVRRAPADYSSKMAGHIAESIERHLRKAAVERPAALPLIELATPGYLPNAEDVDGFERALYDA